MPTSTSSKLLPMQSLGDYRPGRLGSALTPMVHQDNLLDDPAYRARVGFSLVSQHAACLPLIPNDGVSLCAACSSINLCDLKSQAGYLHSESYHALAGSALRKCPLCLLLLQVLHSHAGIGDQNEALVHLNPQITDRLIKLRGIVDKASGEIRTLNVRIDNWLFSSPTAGLRVFALPGTAAAGEGFGARLPYGEEKWATMRTWLDKQMVGDQMTHVQPSPLPTRVIDVGDGVDMGVRLVETAALPAGIDARYTALSYRWGDTNTLLTTKANIRDRMMGIASDIMPKTIRDAVTATRRLGLRYLWVDCLCIIQGDEEDWRKEAAGMGDVYMNAHCTFSTHAANHADDGFLEESLQRERVVACGGHPDGKPFEDEMAAYRTFVESPNVNQAKDGNSDIAPFASDAFFVSKGSYARHHLDRSELSSRGWVLQERILSPRLLHFGPGGSLYLESRKGVEHVEAGFEPNYRPFPRLRSALQRLDRRDPMPAPPEVILHVYTDWYEVIMRYSTCFLTNQEDKLVALQGIARKCQELTGDVLTDGLWRNTSGFCLLWLGQEEPLERIISTQIPSWSWASVKGKIQFPHGTLALDMANIAPEINIVGVETAAGRKSVLQLDNAVVIDTHLRFMEGRVGSPSWDNMALFVNLDHDTRYWDVYDDDGRYLGWASLDHAARQTVDGLVAGIRCIKIASNRNDRIENGWDRGFFVLFVTLSPELGAWQRVGMGQILDRRRFRSQALGMRLV